MARVDRDHTIWLSQLYETATKAPRGVTLIRDDNAELDEICWSLTSQILPHDFHIVLVRQAALRIYSFHQDLAPLPRGFHKAVSLGIN